MRETTLFQEHLNQRSISDIEIQKKAWSDGYTHPLNKSMLLQKRNILYFVDNAAGHSKDSKTKKVKVVFLHKHTASELQLLDQGIIQNFKHC